ncbi:MAG: hypothetical protein WD398_10750 [Cyclobacteriaceae bacterium]
MKQPAGNAYGNGFHQSDHDPTGHGDMDHFRCVLSDFIVSGVRKDG